MRLVLPGLVDSPVQSSSVTGPVFSVRQEVNDGEDDNDQRSEDTIADDGDELDDQVIVLVVDVDEESQDEEDDQDHLAQCEHEVAHLREEDHLLLEPGSLTGLALLAHVLAG